MTVNYLAGLALGYALKQMECGAIRIVHCGDADFDSAMGRRAE